VQNTISRVKGVVAPAETAKRTLDAPISARLLQLSGGLPETPCTQAKKAESRPPETAQRRASSYFGFSVRVYSVFEASGQSGILLDPRTLLNGSVSDGYLKVWDTHPFIRFPDGRVVAYPRELIEIDENL
jgi:hypothetical protein